MFPGFEGFPTVFVCAGVGQQGAVLRQNGRTHSFSLCFVSAEWLAQGRLETVPPVTTEQVDHVLIGRMKGIQGHCNSCYMDAALFRSGGFRESQTSPDFASK